jgi:hypothetical protein
MKEQISRSEIVHPLGGLQSFELFAKVDRSIEFTVAVPIFENQDASILCGSRRPPFVVECEIDDGSSQLVGRDLFDLEAFGDKEIFDPPGAGPVHVGDERFLRLGVTEIGEDAK